MSNTKKILIAGILLQAGILIVACMTEPSKPDIVYKVDCQQRTHKIYYVDSTQEYTTVTECADPVRDSAK